MFASCSLLTPRVSTLCSVRPDSKLLLNVMKEVVNEEDFQERLDAVMDRVNAIEASGSPAVHILGVSQS